MIKGFQIAKSTDYVNKLIKHRDNYNKKGKYLGFSRIHKLYTMQLGTCTDWTGFPRSGKTQMLMELLLNTSKWYGWKHLVYFPDVGNSTEIIADLLHKLTGKTFDNKYENSITDEEIYKEINWLLEHFKILTKVDIKAKITPYQFWDLAVTMKLKDNIHTASIDSWKDMRHDTSKFGRDDKYLEDVLSYRNSVAETHNIHLHTIIHPKLTTKENGKREAPTPYDLKGGSEWFNNGKCMITIHRESMETTDVEFIVHKAKPRSVGTTGGCRLNFDLKKLVYYELEQTATGINRVYATGKGEVKKTNKEPKLERLKLQPNTEFEQEINEIEPF